MPGDPHKLDHDLFACQPELLGLIETLINVIFCAKDRSGVYVEVNSAFVRRTGRSSKADVIGTRASDHFVAELAERYEEQDAQVFETGEPLHDELELIRRTDGTSRLVPDDQAARARRLGGRHRPRLGQPRPRHAVRMTGSDSRTSARSSISCRTTTVRRPDPGRQSSPPLAGCSEAQLERRMKRVFGVTATQHILRVRVEAATRLLADTDLSRSPRSRRRAASTTSPTSPAGSPG